MTFMYSTHELWNLCILHMNYLKARDAPSGKSGGGGGYIWGMIFSYPQVVHDFFYYRGTSLSKNLLTSENRTCIVQSTCSIFPKGALALFFPKAPLRLAQLFSPLAHLSTVKEYYFRNFSTPASSPLKNNGPSLGSVRVLTAIYYVLSYFWHLYYKCKFGGLLGWHLGQAA